MGAVDLKVCNRGLEAVRTLHGHRKAVTVVAWNERWQHDCTTSGNSADAPGPAVLASGSEDGTVRIYLAEQIKSGGFDVVDQQVPFLEEAYRVLQGAGKHKVRISARVASALFVLVE